MMSSTDSDHINYYRILSLTFEASSRTLKWYLRKCYRANGIQTFEEFLLYVFHVLLFLWRKSPSYACGERRIDKYNQGKPVITDAQWNILFQEVTEEGSKCRYIPRLDVDRESMDVTLSACILTNVYKNEILPDVLHAITTLRDNRNMIIHRAAAKMDDAEFKAKWTSTEHAIMTLAKTLPDKEFSEIRRYVKTIRQKLIDEMECTRFVTLLRPFLKASHFSLISHELVQ